MGELLQQQLDECIPVELLVPSLLQLLFAKSETLFPLLQLRVRVSVGAFVTQRASLRLVEPVHITSYAQWIL